MKIGDAVRVKDPASDADAWAHGFVGRIVGFREGNQRLVEVRDQEDNVFCVDLGLLELESPTRDR